MQMHPLSGRRLTISELCKGTANFGSRISHNQYEIENRKRIPCSRSAFPVFLLFVMDGYR